MSESKIKRCCLCNVPIIGYGNNPWPVKDEGECCDECNTTKIIPLRLKLMGLKEED